MLMKTNMTDGDLNLLKAAQACRETKHPFDMEKFGNECGTPGCVLGNYAFRRDLQDVFMLRKYEDLGLENLSQPMAVVPVRHPDDPLDCDGWEIQRHFGISMNEAVELFAYNGCGDAHTAIEAAEYVERFVALRVAERSAA